MVQCVASWTGGLKRHRDELVVQRSLKQRDAVLLIAADHLSKTGNLLVPMIVHGLYDFVDGLVGGVVDGLVGWLMIILLR